MKFIDKIKNIFIKIFGKDNTIKLNAQNSTYPKESNENDFLNRIHVPQEKLKSIPNQSLDTSLKGLDFAIDQWISSLIFQKENNNKVNSYSGLIELGAMEINPYVNEESVLNKINNSKDLNLTIQRSSDGTVAFYHEQKNWKGKPQYRLYLNCKTNNLPEIVNKLNDKLKDIDSFYFKFNAKDQMLKKRRSEQIVFYIKDYDQINDIIAKIREVKKENPTLWEGSENINPFLKKLDGFIGYAPEVDSNIYKRIDGEESIIAPSYNSLLAEALEDSLIHSVRDIASIDENLSRKLKGIYFYNMDPYVYSNVLSDIRKDDKLRLKLIQKMKENLKTASEKNKKLEIKGLEDRTR